MTSEQLRERLRDAAVDVAPASDVVARARQGGRRRIRRRRTKAGGVLVGAVALALVATIAGYRASRPEQVDATASSVSGLLDVPTRGNLADDESATSKARHAYTSQTTRKGHLIWIGRTRFGVAAVLGHRNGDHSVSIITLTRTGGAEYKQAEALLQDPAATGLATSVFGNRLMIVLDVGGPAYYSTRHRFSAEGTTRIWHRVDFDDDGAALMAVPRGDAMVVATSRHPKQVVGSPSPLTLPTVRDNTLGWGVPAAPLRGYPKPHPIPASPEAKQLDWAQHHGAATLFRKAFEHSEFADPLAPWPAVPSLTPWVVYGETPGHQRFVLGEVQYDSEPSHLYAVVDGTVRYLGVADSDALLPVRLQLDDCWVVAAKGHSLAYREDGGGWVDAGRDAAVVPATATRIRVDQTPTPLD